jgi:hypothetical protein
MAARELPNLGLEGGYEEHENGWAEGMALNLLKLSVLVQGGAIDKLAAEPGSPAAGDTYILDETHATHANAVAVYDDGAWVYFEPQEGWLIFNRTAEYYEKFDGTVWAELEMGGGGGGTPTESMVIAVGDETTEITAGTAKVTFRMPYAFTLTAVRASLNVASSSGTPTVDINESGVSVLSTKITIDTTEKTSTTAAVAAVISDPALADDAEITIDIDVAGTGATGLKVYLIGHQ